MLIQSAPAIFHAPRGPDSPFFARLAALDAATLRGVLEARWRRVAPRALAKSRVEGARKRGPTASAATSD
jgi:hypothetical protein